MKIEVGEIYIVVETYDGNHTVHGIATTEAEAKDLFRAHRGYRTQTIKIDLGKIVAALIGAVEADYTFGDQELDDPDFW